MGRPAMRVGDWGKITTTGRYRDPETGHWVKLADRERPPSRTVVVEYTARARVRGLDGHVVSMQRAAASKVAAEQALTDALRAYARPEVGGAVSGGTRMSDLCSLWLAAVESSDRQPSTIDLYGHNVRAYVLPRMGGWRVREVTTPTVDRWLHEIVVGNGVANAKTSRTCLSGMFKLAVRHGAIAVNPVREATSLRRSEPRKPNRSLTREEEARLRAFLAEDPYCASLGLSDVLTFTLGTGARIGEALALTWEKIDLTSTPPTVAITATGEWRSKERGGPRVKERTKTGTIGNRVVPLTATVATMLGKRYAETPETTLNLVFPSAHGTLLDRSNVLSRLRRALDACGLPDVTSHAARKTRATRLHDSGQVSDREVADLLGHADIRTTLTDYIGRGQITSASALVE